jgi:hypothetical protein
MQIPPKKKKVGEMGRPDNSAAFDKAMQEEFMSRKKGAVGTLKPETKKEAEAREMGKSKEYPVKPTINDPRKPRLINAIDRAKIKSALDKSKSKLKNMY